MKKSYYSIFILLIASTSAFAQVDYGSQVQTILTARCNSCHGSGQNTFNSSSYAAVMESTSASNKYDKNHVIPNDPSGSPLVDKIEPNPDHGSRMPQGGTLSDSDIQLIRQWIAEGANATATSNELELTEVKEFRLVGNYPNPFNPSTQIQFDVPVATQYTISIFTVHGQLISEQVGNVSSGRAQIPVNLSGNPTGIYLYRVSAQSNGINQLIGTGRMTLIK